MSLLMASLIKHLIPIGTSITKATDWLPKNHKNQGRGNNKRKVKFEHLIRQDGEYKHKREKEESNEKGLCPVGDE